VVAVGLLSFVLVDPLDVMSGRYESGSQAQLVNLLTDRDTTGVLLIASYDDLYQLQPFRYIRDAVGIRTPGSADRVTELGYADILSMASLGDDEFLNYLVFKGVSHIIVPSSTTERSRIFHRWALRGGIDIELPGNNFEKVLHIGGQFPFDILRVIVPENFVTHEPPKPYAIDWSDVRETFAPLISTVREHYDYTFFKKYEDFPDLGWVYGDESLKLSINDGLVLLVAYNIELHFVAAYGQFAPDQELEVAVNGVTQSISLRAGLVSVLNVRALSGEVISIRNLLPCNAAISFDPQGGDIREFCYGLRDVRVRVAPNS